jgi:hypothetical protein
LFYLRCWLTQACKRCGKPLVAVVPIEDVELLEQLDEDQADAEEAPARH